MSGAWLSPQMDMFDREQVGYMSQCDWSEGYETNFKECVNMFGEGNVIAILKAKSLYQEPVIDELVGCFSKIKELFDFYVDLSDHEKSLIALWVIGTYCHNEFEVYPFLFLNARKGSGKTRTERLISHLSYLGKGDVNTGISESALFRSEQGATLVLDEFESITNKDKQTLREYLQASYKKGATVTRMRKVKKEGKETYEPEQFHPYRPIVMANINGMDDVLGDRCLTLILEKSNNPKFTKILEDFENNNEIKSIVTTLTKLKCRLCRSVVSKNSIGLWNQFVKVQLTNDTNDTNNNNNNNNITTLTTLTTEQHQFFEKLYKMNIDGRNLELIFSLLTLTDLIFPERLEEFIVIFKKIINIKIEEDNFESRDSSLIEFIAQLKNNDFTEAIEGKLLLQGFKEFIGWSTEDTWLNEKWIGNALKRMNLYFQKIRTARGRSYIINISKAKNLVIGK